MKDILVIKGTHLTHPHQYLLTRQMDHLRQAHHHPRDHLPLVHHHLRVPHPQVHPLLVHLCPLQVHLRQDHQIHLDPLMEDLLMSHLHLEIMGTMVETGEREDLHLKMDLKELGVTECQLKEAETWDSKLDLTKEIMKERNEMQLLGNPNWKSESLTPLMEKTERHGDHS